MASGTGKVLVVQVLPFSHVSKGFGVAAAQVISVATHAAGLWLEDQRNVVDVSGAFAGLVAAKLECCCFILEGVPEHGREEIGRRWGNGGSPTEAQIQIVEGGRE